MNHNIIKPSDFLELFKKFNKILLNLDNKIIEETETHCLSCNKQQHIISRVDTSQCDFSRIMLDGPHDLIRLDLFRLNKNICSNCKKPKISNKMSKIDFSVKYWLRCNDESISLHEKLVLNNSNKIYELRAVIHYTYVAELVGGYDVIIKRTDGWYYFNKSYIKKMTFQEIIEIKSLRVYSFYKLVESN